MALKLAVSLPFNVLGFFPLGVSETLIWNVHNKGIIFQIQIKEKQKHNSCHVKPVDC